MSDDILDTTGLKCPLPVLKARKRLKSMRGGEILSIQADDPAALVDVPHFCNEAGHTLLEVADAPDGGQIYRIQKQP